MVLECTFQGQKVVFKVLMAIKSGAGSGFPYCGYCLGCMWVSAYL